MQGTYNISSRGPFKTEMLHERQQEALGRMNTLQESLAGSGCPVGQWDLPSLLRHANPTSHTKQTTLCLISITGEALKIHEKHKGKMLAGLRPRAQFPHASMRLKGAAKVCWLPGTVGRAWCWDGCTHGPQASSSSSTPTLQPPRSRRGGTGAAPCQKVLPKQSRRKNRSEKC